MGQERFKVKGKFEKEPLLLFNDGQYAVAFGDSTQGGKARVGVQFYMV